MTLRKTTMGTRKYVKVALADDDSTSFKRAHKDSGTERVVTLYPDQFDRLAALDGRAEYTVVDYDTAVQFSRAANPDEKEVLRLRIM